MSGDTAWRAGEIVTVQYRVMRDHDDEHMPVSVELVGTGMMTGIWPENLRAARTLPAQAAADAAGAPRMRLPEGPELEGITAALAGWAGTHNPYVFHPGREADRDVWTLGFQLVQDFADERAHRAVQADRSLGQVGLTEPVDLPPALPLTSEATLWFVMRTHLNLARQRLIWQRESSLRINDSRSATIYNHAANIVGEELEATARYGPVAAQPALEVQG